MKVYTHKKPQHSNTIISVKHTFFHSFVMTDTGTMPTKMYKYVCCVLWIECRSNELRARDLFYISIFQKHQNFRWCPNLSNKNHFHTPINVYNKFTSSENFKWNYNYVLVFGVVAKISRNIFSITNLFTLERCFADTPWCAQLDWGVLLARQQ